MSQIEIVAGKRGLVLHVNRQSIAQNAKDGGDRPVYTLKPNGPNSTAIYAREVMVKGATRFIYDGSRLNCGARAWAVVEAGTTVVLTDPMSYVQSKELA